MLVETSAIGTIINSFITFLQAVGIIDPSKAVKSLHEEVKALAKQYENNLVRETLLFNLEDDQCRIYQSNLRSALNTLLLFDDIIGSTLVMKNFMKKNRNTNLIIQNQLSYQKLLNYSLATLNKVQETMVKGLFNNSLFFRYKVPFYLYLLKYVNEKGVAWKNSKFGQTLLVISKKKVKLNKDAYNAIQSYLYFISIYQKDVYNSLYFELTSEI